MEENTDPIDYWQSQLSAYSILAPFAMSVPASSTSIERVFSTAGECVTGKRNCLSGKNLWREKFSLRRTWHSWVMNESQASC